jgi:hypothetical protein
MKTLSLLLTTFYEGDLETFEVDGEACPDCLKISIANMVVKQLGATIIQTDNPYHYKEDPA